MTSRFFDLLMASLAPSVMTSVSLTMAWMWVALAMTLFEMLTMEPPASFSAACASEPRSFSGSFSPAMCQER